MIVGDLELFLIELPAGDGGLRTLLLRVVSESGAEGWGETRKTWHPGELPARRKALLAVLAGQTIHDIESIRALDMLADRALACAVEMALWDLVAQSAGQPLCNLLGGPYRQSIPLAVHLPAGAPESVAHWARIFSAQAILSQTITSTGSLDSDLNLIGTLNEACSDRVQFRLDAQRQYDLRGAVALCSQLEPGSVEFVVDPLADSQFDRLTGVRAAARVPLAAFAAIKRPADVMQLAQSGAARFVLIDPILVGGLGPARWCALVAEAGAKAAGMRIDRTSGLAIAATLQLAAATPALAGGHECSYPTLHDDILVEPLRMVDGMLTVPMAPGLGVRVDRDKVDWYQVEA